jgi:hypothetical protein
VCWLCADDSESSHEALSGSSPKRTLDFTGQSSGTSAPKQAHEGHDVEPLAADFEISRDTSTEGISCPITSSFIEQASAASKLAVLESGTRESSPAGESVPGGSDQTVVGQSSSTAAPEADSGRQRDSLIAEQRETPSVAAHAEQPKGIQVRAHAYAIHYCPIATWVRGRASDTPPLNYASTPPSHACLLAVDQYVHNSTSLACSGLEHCQQPWATVRGLSTFQQTAQAARSPRQTCSHLMRPLWEAPQQPHPSWPPSAGRAAMRTACR